MDVADLLISVQGSGLGRNRRRYSSWPHSRRSMADQISCAVLVSGHRRGAWAFFRGSGFTSLGLLRVASPISRGRVPWGLVVIPWERSGILEEGSFDTGLPKSPPTGW